jgi:phosphoribosylaminoimidazole-succinocarboxamide synthase
MSRPVLVTRTDLPGLKLLFRGKVRDVYELGEGILLVATDRVSAFDCVFPGGLPGKGEVLTRLTCFWLEKLADIVPHHLLATDPSDYPSPAREQAELLRGRSMWVRRADPIPVECVVRGRLVGSAWKEYRVDGHVGGERLPPGLGQGQVLEPPLFTPSTKAQVGHDENVGFAEVARLAGRERAERLRDLSIRIFQRATEHARARGIVLVDTKFEFGVHDGDLMLIDEVLTPDSSRFWRAESVEAGGPPFALDKQVIRDHLEASGWNKQPPAPPLPPALVEEALRRYREAFERLTGQRLWEDHDG